MIIYGINQQQNKRDFPIDRLLKLLDNDGLARYKRYQNAKSAEQFLLGRLLLRYMLKKHYKLTDSAIKITYNEHGKPALPVDNIHFNLSHSGDWIICVITDKPVGIDIERVGKFRPAVAKRLFSTDEYKALMTHQGNARVDYFYTLWTLKESYSKAIGRGLTMPFNDFSIKKSQLDQLFKTNDHYLLKQYNIDPTYKLAICSKTNNFADNIAMIDVEQICDYLLSS